MKFAGIGVVATALSDDARAAAAAARTAGFAGLQFSARGAAIDFTRLSASGRRDFLRLLSSQSQHLIALRANVGSAGLAAADADRILSRLERIFAAAAGLGSPPLCLDLGPLPSPASASRPKPKPTPEQAGVILIPDFPPEQKNQPVFTPAPDPNLIAHVDSVLAEIARGADRYGITVALRSDLSSFAALCRAISAAACPWFVVDFDPVAALQDDQSLDDIFTAIAPLIRHVRARDAVLGDQRRTRSAPLGQGSVDWPAVLSRLDEAGYSGWITIDPLELNDRPAAAAAGLQLLSRLITA